MVIIDEQINAEKFLTKDYLIINKEACYKMKEIRGDEFQLYNPDLTVYEKNEYLLIEDMLFLIDRSNQELVEQSKTGHFDFEKLMLEKDRIYDVYLSE